MRQSENLKQLQQENAALREELDTESPAGGIKGQDSQAWEQTHKNLIQWFLDLHLTGLLHTLISATTEKNNHDINVHRD